MRAVVLRFFVLSTALGVAAVVACSSYEADDDTPAAMDAGGEATLIGETGTPDADADVPIGDVCGNTQGLEQDAPWRIRGGCSKRAGVAGQNGPQNARIEWSVTIPNASPGESSPAIAANRLIWFGTVQGDVIALFSNGAVQGAFRTGGAVRSSPARSATGLTVIGSADGKLYGVEVGSSAVDAGTNADAAVGDAGDEGGAPALPPARALWARPLAPIASSPVIGGDGTIYVGTTDGKLAAVAADGSSTKWSVTTNDTSGSSPAISSSSTIYVGSSDKKLYAWTPDGMPKWSFEAGGALASPVVGGDETVYVGSADGKLYAVTPEGKLRWAYETGGPITSSPCVKAGTIYVGSEDKKLHAVSTPTGAKKWTYATLGAVATPIIGADGTVYVGSTDGNLYAITPSGLLFFAVNTKGSIRSAPAIGDNGLLFVTTDKAVVAIGP